MLQWNHPSPLRYCLPQILRASCIHLNAPEHHYWEWGWGGIKEDGPETSCHLRRHRKKEHLWMYLFKNYFLKFEKKSQTFRNINTIQEDFILGKSLSVSCYVTSSLWKFQCMYLPIIKGILPHHPNTNETGRLTWIHCH